MLAGKLQCSKTLHKCIEVVCVMIVFRQSKRNDEAKARKSLLKVCTTKFELLITF